MWCDISDSITVAEMHSVFAAIEAQFRTFQLPKSVSGDDPEYVHEQTVFSESNLCLVGSPSLGEVLRQALNGDFVPQSTAGATSAVATSNRFKGWASYFVSNYLA